MYGWTPGIGDPTIYGWITVAAYVMAAWLCLNASRGGAKRERRLWLVLAVAMALLAINKQLDLQSLLTAVGRHTAKMHGWYGERRHYQRIFIAVMVIGGLVAMGIVLSLFRRGSGAAKGAIAGFALLIVFILVRASSFEAVDTLLVRHLNGVKVNHLLELGGIAIVGLSALAASRAKRSR